MTPPRLDQVSGDMMNIFSAAQTPITDHVEAREAMAAEADAAESRARVMDSTEQKVLLDKHEAWVEKNVRTGNQQMKDSASRYRKAEDAALKSVVKSFNPYEDKTFDEHKNDHSEVAKVMEMYGLTEDEAKLSIERREVYGCPLENHRGIAMAWAGLLQPHAEDIAAGKPLPPHMVALMMVALKLNRMRRVHKEDNYEDLTVYLSFANAWQKEELK